MTDRAKIKFSMKKFCFFEIPHFMRYRDETYRICIRLVVYIFVGFVHSDQIWFSNQFTISKMCNTSKDAYSKFGSDICKTKKIVPTKT